MKKLLILAVVLIAGCTTGPTRQDYQAAMNEEVESPFFYIPPLNQKDYTDRTWILLAESKTKLWFYDPYTLSEDDSDIVSFDAFFAPREKNQLDPYNATIVGPYRQKIDCFSNHHWSETLYAQNVVSKAPEVSDIKPVNGSGWVKIKPRTAMAYVRTRVCGRKFIDDTNVNYFLFQSEPISLVQSQVELQPSSASPRQSATEVRPEKPPVFYDVINNEVTIVDAKNDIRQLRLSSYVMEKDFPKQADYLFTANCQSNTYNLTAQGASEKSSGAIGAKDALPAVAFNRACASHGAYMKINNRGAR